MNISVIIPYYNEEQVIRKTFFLIANQTYSPREVLFIDSGSTDESFKILQHLISTYVGVIKFKNFAPKLGMPSSSRNFGIKNAIHEFIAHMDCGLKFPINWLEKQISFLEHHPHLHFVSGVVFLKGTNHVDTSAAAQTYGFERKRVVLPGSLIHRSIYDKVGFLKEGKRAGDDVDWVARAAAKDIARGTNEDVVIEYYGVNFAACYISLFRKVYYYSQFDWGIHHHFTPHIYMLVLLSMPIVSLYLLKHSLYLPFFYLFLLYFILRGYAIPFIKSQSCQILIKKPNTIFTLPIVGFIIDLAKTFGYFRGYIKKL